MNDKITIRFDLDDVLNDLCAYWLEVHEAETGEKLKASQWDMHELSVHGVKVYDHFTSRDFYINVPIKDGARRTIDIVEKNPHIFDYIIVSSCRQEDDAFEYINYQKLEWCGEHLTETAQMSFVLTGDDKSEFKADIIIDDKPDNLLNQGCENCLKILFSAGHNKSIKLSELKDSDKNSAIIKVRNHKELQDILHKIIADQSLERYLPNGEDK